jgi:uncharacterized protein YeaO (DUF488 family)
MRHPLLLISGLLTGPFAFSQKTCDSTDLQADKARLQSFWTAFKDAINHNDKAKLAGLVSFLLRVTIALLTAANNTIGHTSR